MPQSENTNFNIREATPADAEQVLKFLIDLDAQVGTMLLEPGERTTTPAQQADILARFQTAPKSHFLIAQIDTAIIGFCAIDAQTLRRVQQRGLLAMGILPAFQNQGIGNE
jgi:N-acetylglutamate synthase-like GNAT family acetyltransferase